MRDGHIKQYSGGFGLWCLGEQFFFRCNMKKQSGCSRSLPHLLIKLSYILLSLDFFKSWKNSLFHPRNCRITMISGIPSGPCLGTQVKGFLCMCVCVFCVFFVLFSNSKWILGLHFSFSSSHVMSESKWNAMGTPVGGPWSTMRLYSHHWSLACVILESCHKYNRNAT